MLGFSAQANAFIRHVYSALGGAGFAFLLLGIDDATRTQIVTAVHQIGDGVSSILAGLGVLVPIIAGLVARYTAKPEQQVKAVEAQGHTVVRGEAAPSPGVKIQSHWLVGLLAMAALALAACGDKAPSPASQVYAAKNAYEAALIGAVAYNNLPRCGTPTSPPACSDQAAVGAIRKANDAARTTLDAAEKTVRDPTVNADVKAAIVVGATNAVSALQAILAIYAPKKGA